MENIINLELLRQFKGRGKKMSSVKLAILSLSHLYVFSLGIYGPKFLQTNVLLHVGIIIGKEYY